MSQPTGSTSWPRSWSETRRIADILRKETVGGALLLVGRGDRPWSGPTPRGVPAYETLRDTRVGPAALHLDLTLGTWAADGLLAIFFFVAGLELKREFVAGDLREPAPGGAAGRRRRRRDGRPRAALRAGQPRRRGRRAARLGDPVGDRHRLRPRRPRGDQHPPAQRAAHVPADAGRRRRPAGDRRHRDLLHRRPLARAASLLRSSRWRCSGCSCSGGSARGGCCCRWPPLTWVLVHASGVHATVAGVLLAFTVPVVRSEAAGGPMPGLAWPSTSSTASGRCRPASPCRSSRSSPPGSPSAGSPASARRSATASRSGSSSGWSSARRSASARPPGWSPGSPAPSSTRTSAGPTSSGSSLLGGIGFTVSLLITELAYGAGSPSYDAREGRHPRRHARRRAAGDRRPAAAQPAVPGDLRGRAARRRPDGIPDVYQDDRAEPFADS